MGRSKDLLIEQDEQGWAFSPDVAVCHNCLSDPELIGFVKKRATAFTCDFCDRTGKKQPISIPFDDLMAILGDTFREYYDRAANAMSWDGEDHRYFGTTYDTDDIVRHWGTIRAYRKKNSYGLHNPCQKSRGFQSRPNTEKS